jgi:hypothetical protein
MRRPWAVNEKQALIWELEKRGLTDMARKARAGEYSNFGSPHPLPVVELVRQLEGAGHRDLAARAKNGDFDHER